MVEGCIASLKVAVTSVLGQMPVAGSIHFVPHHPIGEGRRRHLLHEKAKNYDKAIDRGPFVVGCLRRMHDDLVGKTHRKSGPFDRRVTK